MEGRTGFTSIGNDKLKQRRLRLPVKCHRNLTVGQCVPFYFCPRSVMLYINSRGNHPEVTYAGGQEFIVHLQVDMSNAVIWLNQNHLRWSFSSGNAATEYTSFYADSIDLDKLDWGAISTNNWRECIHTKQAEFLIEQRCPTHLIECIGVLSRTTQKQVEQILHQSETTIPVMLRPDWYY